MKTKDQCQIFVDIFMFTSLIADNLKKQGFKGTDQRQDTFLVLNKAQEETKLAYLCVLELIRPNQ